MFEPHAAPVALPADEEASPLEAIVLEEPPVRVAYPYASGCDLIPAPQAAAAAYLREHAPVKGKTYVVPKRFGISAILALMTGMAFLFGFIRLLELPPAFYLFFGTMALAICIAQMAWGKVPREASIGVGAVLMPIFAIVTGIEQQAISFWGLPVLFAASLAWGAFSGYLMGTLAAGVFLAMEKLEPFLTRRRARELAVTEPPARTDEA